VKLKKDGETSFFDKFYSLNGLSEMAAFFHLLAKW
jgi:hypothetical protein